MIIALAQEASGAAAHRTRVDHLDHPFLEDRAGGLDKKRRQHERAHDEGAGETELIDAKKRAVELRHDAFDGDLIAARARAPVRLPSSLNS